MVSTRSPVLRDEDVLGVEAAVDDAALVEGVEALPQLDRRSGRHARAGALGSRRKTARRLRCPSYSEAMKAAVGPVSTSTKSMTEGAVME